jgi:hypothetical protein
MNSFSFNNGGMGSEWQEGDDLPEDVEGMPFSDFPEEQVEPPIEERASEAEKLYANLLMVTGFERDFIEEMLEFEPDEESEMRIDELRRKRREMKELAQQGFPPNGSPTKTILL